MSDSYQRSLPRLEGMPRPAVTEVLDHIFASCPLSEALTIMSSLSRLSKTIRERSDLGREAQDRIDTQCILTKANTMEILFENRSRVGESEQATVNLRSGKVVALNRVRRLFLYSLPSWAEVWSVLGDQFALFPRLKAASISQAAFDIPPEPNPESISEVLAGIQGGHICMTPPSCDDGLKSFILKTTPQFLKDNWMTFHCSPKTAYWFFLNGSYPEGLRRTRIIGQSGESPNVTSEEEFRRLLDISYFIATVLNQSEPEDDVALELVNPQFLLQDFSKFNCEPEDVIRSAVFDTDILDQAGRSRRIYAELSSPEEGEEGEEGELDWAPVSTELMSKLKFTYSDGTATQRAQAEPCTVCHSFKGL